MEIFKIQLSRERVRYLQSCKDAVVLGADVGATAKWGHGDGVPVQHWQVVAVPTVWESASVVVGASIKGGKESTIKIYGFLEILSIESVIFACALQATCHI